MSGVRRVAVTRAEAGQRLDRWLRRRFPGLTQGQIEKFCRTGQLRVDGARVRASARLNGGAEVRVPPLPETPASARPRAPISKADWEFARALVIHRDDECLVVNKPAGLAVQGGSRTARHLDGLLDALVFEAEERPRLVHRLDRDTSGALVLARSRAAAERLTHSFARREARKLYWALVAGVPRPAEGEINLALVKGGGAGRERVFPAGPDDAKAMRAVSRYAVLARAGTRAALVALEPLTGRTHQLRAHMAAMGWPILGDGKYGGADAHIGAGIARQVHLHARMIDLPHPRGRGRLHVEAEPPPHLVASAAALGFDLRLGQVDPFADWSD